MPKLKSPSRLKLLVRILIVLDLLVILVIVGNRYLTRWRGESDLDSVKAELESSDPGWRLKDVLATREANFPPEDQNIVAVAMKALPEKLPEYRPWELHFEDWFFKKDFNQKAKLEDLEKAKQVRDNCRPVIDELRKIRSLKSGGSRLDPKRDPFSSIVDSFKPIRKVVGILEMDALVAGHESNAERAFTSLQAALAMTRGLNSDPFFISWLARYGISGDVVKTLEHVLAHTESVDALSGLQADLLNESNLDLESVFRRGERAYLDHMFEVMDAHFFDAENAQDDDPRVRYAKWHERSRIPSAHSAALRFQTQLLASSREPEATRETGHESAARQFHEATARDKKDKSIGSLSILIDKDPNSIGKLANTRLRMAVAAIACERYRKQSGHWPEKLQDIPKTILTSVPSDAFNDLPLPCAKTSFGLIVFCSTPGATELPDYSKPGATLPKECFRLWDITQRSRPQQEKTTAKPMP